ncbi:antitoxin family protein [Pseudanabaenaceae cyanobacterium LEGE 13415]|nr:antitoxin family protein [Pseudanabaenaceae cyanobacterium LEGE 13415]
MPQLTVIYEAGILKPIEPLDLPEGQYLQIQILETVPNLSPLEQALQPLIQNGSLTLPTSSAQTPLPEIDLEAYSVDAQFPNLLSDSIIEDRGSL